VHRGLLLPCGLLLRHSKFVLSGLLLPLWCREANGVPRRDVLLRA
jgi:hypothetical protein